MYLLFPDGSKVWLKNAGGLFIKGSVISEAKALSLAKSWER